MFGYSCLRSGSSGNSTVVTSRGDCILVDAGVSYAALKKCMAAVGRREIEDIQAVILSHEHQDHNRGVLQLVKKHPDVVMYVSKGTLEQFREDVETNARPEIRGIADIDRIEVFDSSTPFQIGTMVIEPFPVSHVAADPCGFTIEGEGIRLTIAIDLGMITPVVVKAINSSMATILESNYDVGMLEQEINRPQFSRDRTASDKGHLSNDQVADFLRGDFNGNVRDLVLAHISKDTNTPDMPREMAELALKDREMPWVDVYLAKAKEPLEELFF